MFYRDTVSHPDYENKPIEECREFNRKVIATYTPYVQWVRNKHGRRLGVVIGYVNKMTDNMLIGWSMCNPTLMPLIDPETGDQRLNPRTGKLKFTTDKFNPDRALYIAFKRSMLSGYFLGDPFAYAHTKAIPVIKKMLLQLFHKRVNMIPSIPEYQKVH